MPDYENVMSLRLDKPGTYVFGCLEYCGLRHHMMLREFEVTP
jgi:heme/copper-type cytochrome/quinol oxidase subunit 2